MRLPTLLLFAASAVLSTASVGLIEPTITVRAGYDSNPLGTGGTAATIMGSEESATYGAVAGFGFGTQATAATSRSFRLSYSGEFVRFADLPGENYTSHRFGANGATSGRDWKFSADASALFIDGSQDTLPSTSSANANGVAVWREHRRQWQYRAKAQAQKTAGAFVVRGNASLLACDYQTHVTAGKFAFADRSDLAGALDCGWKQGPNSLWLVGLRAGQQVQAVIPLPNCDFDYSNNYFRLALGWEGKPTSNISLSIAGGPDFRHYFGKIDPAAMTDGRDRTSFWCEGSLSAKVSPTITLTGKIGRNDWLSSTGKSAYNDFCAETAASWVANRKWTLRLTAKVHRCDFFPLVRDDWESLIGGGAIATLSPHTQISFDLLSHHGWNGLSGSPQRYFDRFTANIGFTARF